MTTRPLQLFEVFASVQGEGPFVGTSTLFVRLAGCDLRCAWCDTPATWRPVKEARFEVEAGSGSFTCVPSPVSIDDVVAGCETLGLEGLRFISFTGGEPLLQAEPLAALAGRLSDRGPEIYLETHGLATEALAQVGPQLDVISMDWKLASDVRREGMGRSGGFHAEHAAFLRLARDFAETYVKVVVSENTEDGELEQMVGEIANIDPSTPLVLQPVTPAGQIKKRPSAQTLMHWQSLCQERLSDVRIIPQTHPLLGAL